MLKRISMGGREDNYEHVLMCLICRSLFDDYDHQPKFLPCHHTFCKDCLREYVRQFGDEIECPSCRKVANIPTAGVTALQTNFYVKYIHSLVCGYGSGATTSVQQCSRHTSEKLHYFCRQCDLSICKQCCTPAECGQHEKVAITRATEESHQSLDTAFSAANSTIEGKKVKLDKTLKALADEKDQALMNIDSAFDQHVHTIQRRATLLKNKVIAIYNEHKDKLENDLEEISTALTCIVSIKDYHEEAISQANFKDIPKGIEELEEVDRNMSERIHPAENHIVFETNHGVEKFKGSLRDLGRVRCSRPIAPRADPEGNAEEDDTNSQTPDTTPCMESKPFSSPEPMSPLDALLSPPPEGTSSACRPDVTETSDIKPEVSESKQETSTNTTEVGRKQPPEGIQSEEHNEIKPEVTNHVTKVPDLDAGKCTPDVSPNVSPRKQVPDVKPKDKVAPQAQQNHVVSKQNHKEPKQNHELDANRNRQTTDPNYSSSDSKPNSIARLDLGRFSRGPGRKSDRQNGNVVGASGSKIPTKPGGATSPGSDAHKQGPAHTKAQASQARSPQVQGGSPSKVSKHSNMHRLDKIRAAHAQGSKHRMSQVQAQQGPVKPPRTPPSGGGSTTGSGSIIAQAIAATSQERQSKHSAPAAPVTRPDSLLKPVPGHLTGGGGGGVVPAAPTMPDLLPESVLKVMQSGTDDEKLRAEKEYYHLLYTSYDEEELLRELKSGAAPAPSGLEMVGADGAHLPWSRAGRTSLEDSDNSWLTTSSASEGASEESEGNNNEENDILAAPQQTTF